MTEVQTTSAAAPPAAPAAPAAPAYHPPTDCCRLMEELTISARGGHLMVLSTDASNPLPITRRRLWRILIQIDASDDGLPADLEAMLPKDRGLPVVGAFATTD